MKKAILDYIEDHYAHFGCYPMEVEYNGKIYSWEEYWTIIE